MVFQEQDFFIQCKVVQCRNLESLKLRVVKPSWQLSTLGLRQVKPSWQRGGYYESR